jgi:phosphoribosylformylglycinamidine synthase PurS subunit
MEGNKLYIVELLIYLKENVRDPEGETIFKYLVSKSSIDVVEVKAGKCLRFKVNSRTKEEAEKLIKRIADELMLYNPLIHKIEVRIYDSNN